MLCRIIATAPIIHVLDPSRRIVQKDAYRLWICGNDGSEALLTAIRGHYILSVWDTTMNLVVEIYGNEQEQGRMVLHGSHDALRFLHALSRLASTDDDTQVVVVSDAGDLVLMTDQQARDTGAPIVARKHTVGSLP
jgi:hypothetical protein